MRKAIGVLTLLAIVAVATAEVEVRIWTTSVSPVAPGGPITFEAGYGPFTPFAVKDNGTPESGPRPYDVHRNYVSSTNLGSVRIPKLTPVGIPDVVEPVFDPAVPGDSEVYIWAAFCGPGDIEPLKPGLGWEVADVRVQAFNVALVTTESLVLEPHWYQYEVYGGSPLALTGLRWAETSDMTGNMVTMVGLGTGTPAATGWYAGVVSERMQTWALDDLYGGGGGYGAGAILLGAIRYVEGRGSLYIGLEYNGINATDTEGVTYYPGSEEDGINADLVDAGAPVRIGQTPEATWIPEPASLLLLSLGLLALRRR
jgi:hypothetical protein